MWCWVNEHDNDVNSSLILSISSNTSFELKKGSQYLKKIIYEETIRLIRLLSRETYIKIANKTNNLMGLKVIKSRLNTNSKSGVCKLSCGFWSGLESMLSENAKMYSVLGTTKYSI